MRRASADQMARTAETLSGPFAFCSRIPQRSLTMAKKDGKKKEHKKEMMKK